MRFYLIIRPAGAALMLLFALCGCMTPQTKVDSAYLQKLIDSIPKETGGEIQLDKGIYPINATITMPSGISITGEGPSTILKATESFNGSFFKNSDPKGNTKIFIAAMKFEGNRAKTKEGSPAIFFRNVKGAAIQDIWMDGISGEGILLENCDSVKAVNSKFTGCASAENAKAAICLIDSIDCIIAENKIEKTGKCGIALLYKSARNILDENSIEGANNGINLSKTSSNLLKDNKIQGAQIGISLNSAKNNTLLNNCIKESSDAGVIAQNDKDSKLVRNRIESNGKTAAQIIDSDGTVIQNNLIEDYAGEGIEVRNSKHLKMLFNIFDENKKNIFNIDSKSKIDLKTLNGIRKTN